MNGRIMLNAVLLHLLIGVALYGPPGALGAVNDVSVRLIAPDAFQSFVKNWDEKSEPVLYALIRNPAEWNAVFHPAPTMGGTRPFAPDASLYEKEQVLVIAKVLHSSASLTFDSVVADGNILRVRYLSKAGNATQGYTMKKHLKIVLPKVDYSRIEFEENGKKAGVLKVGRGQWSVPSMAPACEQVQAAVEAWIDELGGNAYKTTLRAADGRSPFTAKRVNDHLFSFRDGGYYIGIGFTKPPSAESSLEELRATFKHIALDRIPVPGIEAAGWDTRLRTSVSSFKEGVTLESWENGVLRLRVQTEFFAAYGQRNDIRVPADAGMPRGAYFRIRKPIKADLTIEGRLIPASPSK